MSKPGVFGRIKRWFGNIYAKFLRLHIALRILIVFVGMIGFVGVGAGIAALTASSGNFGSTEQKTADKSDALPTASRPGESDSIPKDEEATDDQKETEQTQQPQQTTPTNNIGTVPSVTDPAAKPTFSVSASAATLSTDGKTLTFTLTVTRENGLSGTISNVTLAPAEKDINCPPISPSNYSDSMNVTCTVSNGVTAGGVFATVTIDSKSVSTTASFE